MFKSILTGCAEDDSWLKIAEISEKLITCVIRQALRLFITYDLKISGHGSEIHNFVNLLATHFPLPMMHNCFVLKQLESLSNGRRKVRLNFLKLFINLGYCYESTNKNMIVLGILQQTNLYYPHLCA